MNENLNDGSPSDQLTNIESGIDRSRRKLGAAGIAGSAVILSLASKSAVAGWGSCTGSELASGNLSRNGTANPCGCSPGFWWNDNGKAIWTSSNYTLSSLYPRTQNFNVLFVVNFLNPDKALSGCGPHAKLVNTKGFSEGKAGTIAMHAIAALLNAQFYGSRYPAFASPSQVISEFQQAFTMSSATNNQALTDFLIKADIYKSHPDLWCNGKEE